MAAPIFFFPHASRQLLDTPFFFFNVDLVDILHRWEAPPPPCQPNTILQPPPPTQPTIQNQPAPPAVVPAAKTWPAVEALVDDDEQSDNDDHPMFKKVLCILLWSTSSTQNSIRHTSTMV